MTRHMRKEKQGMLIRDPIHKDMEFNKEEEAIIRTKQFQRLHSVRQLGSTYHVYPAAMHTRFEHSLGTCFLTKRIIENIEKNGFRFPKFQRQTIILASLVHDIGHVPFGHMLEDELEVIPKHDRNERIRELIYGDDLANALGRYKTSVFRILAARRSSDLKSPYCQEIIKNTISADLLDYLKRDVYFSGLTRDYDNRIFRYFNIATYPKDQKNHLIIEVAEKGRRCEDVLTEIEHLLQIRYIIAERVYCYHTKIAADAMIGKAIAELNFSPSNLIRLLYTKGDEELINYLATGDHRSETSKTIGSLFKERKIFRMAYMITREELEACKEEEFKDLIKNYYGRKKSKKFEQKICDKLGISYDDIVLFCHEEGMNLKAADVFRAG